MTLEFRIHISPIVEAMIWGIEPQKCVPNLACDDQPLPLLLSSASGLVILNPCAIHVARQVQCRVGFLVACGKIYTLDYFKTSSFLRNFVAVILST